MESLRLEIAPFGIHTTIVNPGFFRTELLTPRSTTYAATVIDDYDDRREAYVAAWTAQSGKQSGDPAKLADALVTVAGEEPPMRRFLPGALATAEQTVVELQMDIEAQSPPLHFPRRGGGVTMEREEEATMTDWTENEAAEIGGAEELDLASRRPDGSLRPFVTIWVVRVGNDLYVRSVNGRSCWLPRAVAAGEGQIRAGGLELDVMFEVADSAMEEAVTTAYHAKYDRYGPSIVGTVVSAASAVTTLRIVRR